MKRANPAIALAAGLLINFAIFGQFFLFSLYFEDVRGLSALQTGLAFLPQPLLLAFAGLPVGRLIARFGPRVPIAAGRALAGVGAILLATVQADSGYPQIALGLLLFGAGSGAVIPAVTAAAVGSVAGPQVGVAAAALNASRQMGGVLGVAVLGGLAGTGGSLLEATHAGLAVAAVGLGAIALLGVAGMAPRRRAEPAPERA